MNKRFALAALALAMTFGLPTDASPSKARTTMLRENSRPPDFTLLGDVAMGGSSEQPDKIALHKFLGRKRILLLFAPEPAFLSAIPWREYQERDLVVLAILQPSSALSGAPAAKPLWLLTDDDGHVFREYGARTLGTTFYLIGKDGTIKMARREPPTKEELFGLIDAMPMRRQEMRKHQ